MGKLRKVTGAGAAAAAAYTVYRVRYRKREQPVETFVDDVSRVADTLQSTGGEGEPLSAEEDRYGADEEE